ncbi:N5-glutamine methyltransferase family protein [Acinetobacter haemolyticus]|uniref:N5-glutamine methyltransferase family protein n=1 Tax=Acinetobacter haemolyticus TaxID=29430 RepID=UPI000F73AAFE|nr:class I SAM-dependent methyltransferase [Acinetobacter haemolyticus]RSN77053.1 class I SAM-dependent methyltransferase [Acinetobacter haemolyticus]
MNQKLNIDISQEKALLYLLNFLKEKHYRFTVITPLTHERIFRRKQKSDSEMRSLKDIFGWNMPFYPEELDSDLFFNLKKAHLIRIEDNQWLSNVRVASLNDELFIHSAFPTIENDAVFFGPDTYRFYYHLKQYLLNESYSIKRSVELCCGASPVAIAMSKSFPDIQEIFAVDINPKALFFSQINKKFVGVDHVFPIYSDLFSNLEGNFDLIFANPPYLMDPYKRQYRHGGTQLDGTDLAFNILKEGIKRLTPNGKLFLYTGIAISHQGNKFLEAIQEWIQEYPAFQYTYEEIDPDVFGEELEQPAYQHIERIAVVLVKLFHKE